MSLVDARIKLVAGSWLVDSVFIRHVALRLFNASPDCVRTMHDKPGSVFRVNRGRQETQLDPC